MEMGVTGALDRSHRPWNEVSHLTGVGTGVGGY